MALTLIDIADRLKQFPEVELLELLDISSEELVDRFMDRIEDNADNLETEVE